MSESLASPDTVTAASNGEKFGRVWRACLECRKKKSKCDGKDICRTCKVRNRDCVYLESNDNASSSRQVLATLDERCKRMDDLCQRMELMMENFNKVVGSLDIMRTTTPLPINQRSDQGVVNNILSGEDEFDCANTQGNNDIVEMVYPDEDKAMEHTPPASVQDHVMTTDSYGKLRYVGGTGTMVMIEALKSLTPDTGPSPTSPAKIRQFEKSASVLELPFFNRGQTWPALPYLPKSDQLVRPPRYVSDLLVDLYFRQLHWTMPVIFKPHFMQRYNILLNDRSSKSVDVGFLSVFFAVCACASSLLPRAPGSSPKFTGLQYYESALLLHFKTTGEGSIEQVQCLALLSMCTAGWNTLAQSWKFAGQAVRAAQDLGLHRSPERGTGETLKEELCRRIWWSVYGLDRLLAICLGRPIGIEDSDCDCELPLDLNDTQLEAYCKAPSTGCTESTTPSCLAGFIALSKLCQVSGKIIRAVNPLRLRTKNKAKLREQLGSVVALDAELADWLKTVPNCIKFSANDVNAESSHLTMCVILYIVHAACVINLHRPLIVESRSVLIAEESSSLVQCIGAARSCIQAAELIQARVPPSHHLAFCTHYLSLAGVLLIRSPTTTTTEDFTPEVESCVRYLADLENVWAGAQRSRLIIEELLKQSRTRALQWDYETFDTDEITDYMLRQEKSGFNFTGF